MRVRMMAVACVMAMMTMAATAQMAAGTDKGPAAGTVIQPSTAVDAQLSLIEMEMMGAAKAMPAEKYSFAPSAAAFAAGQKTEFGKVRTFGEQVAHVAQANYYFYSLLSGMKPDVDMRGDSEADGQGRGRGGAGGIVCVCAQGDCDDDAGECV